MSDGMIAWRWWQKRIKILFEECKQRQDESLWERYRKKRKECKQVVNIAKIEVVDKVN